MSWRDIWCMLCGHTTTPQKIYYHYRQQFIVSYAVSRGVDNLIPSVSSYGRHYIKHDMRMKIKTKKNKIKE